jgi:undecaprenyl-diphosphatase
MRIWIVLATAATGVVGLALLKVLPIVLGLDREAFEVEQLFGNPRLIAGALAAAGVLIAVVRAAGPVPLRPQSDIGAPGTRSGSASCRAFACRFAAFSRSGATISTGLLLGISQQKAEEFSFALAVVLTPAVIVKELQRFVKAHAATSGTRRRQAWCIWLGPVSEAWR